MKEIILFRFHRDPWIVKNRIDILNYFNPDMELYGLYGGGEGRYDMAISYLNKKMRHIYKLQLPYTDWAWCNGDLAVVDWYKQYGSNLDFDRVYLIEWDALVLQPLDVAYERVPAEVIGLTRLKYLDEIKKEWYWTKRSPHKEELEELMKRMKINYGYSGRQKVSIFTLPVFPRKFLQEYSKIAVEMTNIGGIEKPLVHDEIRLPLFAEYLGFQLIDTGFFPGKKTEEKKYFNADSFLVKKKDILNEMRKKDGRRIFHPYRDILEIEEMLLVSSSDEYIDDFSR